MNKRSNKHENLAFKIKELHAFMRLETCLYMTSIGTAGYLLFNPIGFNMLALSLATFFMATAAYSYNFMKDTKEDSINNKGRLNLFTTNGKGGIAVAAMLCLGIFFSLLLPPFTIMLFLASVPLIIIYSKYRLKEVFILKNIYTGAGTGFVLVIGASAGGTLTGAVIYPFIATFLFGIMANMLGDIRGYAGDLAAGVKTLPVKMGLAPATRIFHAMMLGLSICILFGYQAFLPMVPFTMLISFFLAAGIHRAARYTLLCTFISLSAFMLMAKIQGL